MPFVLDCLLAAYLGLASLTIWCAQTTVTAVSVEPVLGPVIGRPAKGSHRQPGILRLVAPCLASLPHALGSIACLVAALALTIGAPFDLRYGAVAAFGVALYLIILNIGHLVEDSQHGVPLGRLLRMRSLLPAILAMPMLLAGMRLL